MKSGKKSERGYWFGLILYPDNKDMMDLLDYLVLTGTKMLWIKHRAHEEPKQLPLFTSSISELKDPVKEHIHVMIKYKSQRTASAVVKSFAGVVHHVELIHSPPDMARYFLHWDFASLKSGKETYQLTDLRWTDTAMKNALLELESSDDDSAVYETVLRVGTNCTCFAELMQMLMIEGDAQALKWVTNHSGAVRSMFPYYPQNLRDIALLQGKNNLNNGGK